MGETRKLSTTIRLMGIAQGSWNSSVVVHDRGEMRVCYCSCVCRIVAADFDQYLDEELKVTPDMNSCDVCA